MVENTESIVKAAAVETKKVYSTVKTPIYKAPIRQRNMQVGTTIPGRLYDYKGKDVNNEGTFYLTSAGYMFADENVHIK